MHVLPPPQQPPTSPLPLPTPPLSPFPQLPRLNSGSYPLLPYHLKLLESIERYLSAHSFHKAVYFQNTVREYNKRADAKRAGICMKVKKGTARSFLPPSPSPNLLLYLHRQIFPPSTIKNPSSPSPPFPSPLISPKPPSPIPAASTPPKNSNLTWQNLSLPSLISSPPPPPLLPPPLLLPPQKKIALRATLTLKSTQPNQPQGKKGKE